MTFDNNNQTDFRGDTVVEMHSYSAPEQLTAKHLEVTRANSLSENPSAESTNRGRI